MGTHCCARRLLDGSPDGWLGFRWLQLGLPAGATPRQAALVQGHSDVAALFKAEEGPEAALGQGELKEIAQEPAH